MLAHSILALGAFALSSVSAQSSNICEASPYRALGCLASNTAAASECTSRLPAVISTITSTTSVLSQITETPRPKTVVESQATVSITNLETSTETVTW
jgi:transcription elongation GreA/GreB family factor